MTSEHQATVSFSLSRLEAWAPGVVSAAEWAEWARGERAIERDGEPRLTQMPAMLRRHAGRLDRMTCEVAYRVLDGASGVPMVLCSRYGEVARSVDLLTSLARSDELSPGAFGLSVHNAAGGLFTMARRDGANCIALAGGDASAHLGLVEACGLLADGAERVLIVAADCPLPPIYEQYADVEPVAFAWGCLVAPPGADAITLEWRGAREPAAAEPRRALPAALAALRFLLDGSQACEHDVGGVRWRWSRGA